MQRFKPDFIATVTYFLPDEGGRDWPVHSGYRPVIRFADYSTLILAENVFTDREDLSPGDSTEANITINAAEMFCNALYEGQHFEIYEPPKLIGYGIINKVMNVDLLMERSKISTSTKSGTGVATYI